MSLYHRKYQMSFRKLFSLLGILLFCSYPVTAEDFTGRVGNTTHTWIDINVTNGVADACGVEGRFNGSITRGAALHRLFAEFGIDTTGSSLSNEPFDDVSYYHQYYQDIAYAYNNYIVSDTDLVRLLTDLSRLFKPDCYVVRVEFVKMVLNTIGIPTDPSLYSQDPPFPDMDRSAWYYNYIRAAYNLGIIQGTDENPARLMPNLPLSETEYLLIIERAKKYYRPPVTNDPSSPNGSHFDGAGSLIQPDQDCWGCDHDEAVMQPHSSTASTVVFQWKQNKNSGSCRYLTIRGPVGFQAVITTKEWSQASKDGNSYLVTLPVTIFNSGTFNSETYTTTSVTSMTELSSATTISASCSSSDDYLENREELSPAEEVSFPGGYVWAGNGSIISGGATGCTDGFGCIRDDAIALDKTALTAFQWQASSNCKTLKIFQTGGDGGFSGHLKYKPYDSPNWTDQGSVSFPYYISGIESSFYVVSVETSGGMIESGAYIRAECVN